MWFRLASRGLHVPCVGVSAAGVSCLWRGCDHYSVVDVERYCDDVSVPRFVPRLRCVRSGHYYRLCYSKVHLGMSV